MAIIKVPLALAARNTLNRDIDSQKVTVPAEKLTGTEIIDKVPISTSTVSGGTTVREFTNILAKSGSKDNVSLSPGEEVSWWSENFANVAEGGCPVMPKENNYYETEGIVVEVVGTCNKTNLDIAIELHLPTNTGTYDNFTFSNGGYSRLLTGDVVGFGGTALQTSDNLGVFKTTNEAFHGLRLMNSMGGFRAKVRLKNNTAGTIGGIYVGFKVFIVSETLGSDTTNMLI